MSANPGFDALLNVYLDIFKETMEEVQGYYLDRKSSMFETLATIDAATASRPVSARCATLAAQVEHTAFYMDVINDAMRGKNVEGQDWGYIWRTVSVVTPEEWATIQNHLRTSYERVRNTIAHPDEWHSMEAFADALAILAHTAYHLGEIRQALCTLRP